MSREEQGFLDSFSALGAIGTGAGAAAIAAAGYGYFKILPELEARMNRMEELLKATTSNSTNNSQIISQLRSEIETLKTENATLRYELNNMMSRSHQFGQTMSEPAYGHQPQLDIRSSNYNPIPQFNDQYRLYNYQQSIQQPQQSMMTRGGNMGMTNSGMRFDHQPSHSQHQPSHSQHQPSHSQHQPSHSQHLNRTKSELATERDLEIDALNCLDS
jgi:regulator of replication initiation timing